MLKLHKKKNALPPSAEREKIEREIAFTDETIDEIVYGLYWNIISKFGMISGGGSGKIKFKGGFVMPVAERKIKHPYISKRYAGSRRTACY